MKSAARLFIAAALIIILSLALGVLVPRPTTGEPAATPSRQILLLSSAIHTDLALPLDDALRQRFAFLAGAGVAIERPDAAYLIIGWGGRAFYIGTPTWGDLKPGPVFKALTIDRSVLHLELAGAIDTTHSSVMPLDLDEAGYGRLLDFVDATLERDAAGRPQPIAGAAYGLNDAFFEAKGAFNLLIGCNTWTSAALSQAGIATGLWTPLPGLLHWSLSFHDNDR